MLLRLLNADVLPFEFSDLSDTLGRYLKEVQKLTDEEREKSRDKNRWLKDQTFAAVYDPRQPYFPPNPDDPVPFLNFAPLENAMARLQDSARAYSTALGRLRAREQAVSPDTQRALDTMLYQTERAFLSEKGLPQRPWYRHQIYAPGFYTGYGVKTLPGVREAIEGRRWAEATEQIQTTAHAIERAATEIQRAVSMLGP